MRRKTVGRVLRNQGRGTVRVEEDATGHQWVTCTGCQLDEYTPGVLPASGKARRHARECTR